MRVDLDTDGAPTTGRATATSAMVEAVELGSRRFANLIVRGCVSTGVDMWHKFWMESPQEVMYSGAYWSDDRLRTAAAVRPLDVHSAHLDLADAFYQLEFEEFDSFSVLITRCTPTSSTSWSRTTTMLATSPLLVLKMCSSHPSEYCEGEGRGPSGFVKVY